MHTVPPGQIAVLIADRSPVVGERLCALLAEEKSLRVIGQALAAEDTLARMKTDPPGAVVLDLQMADGKGPDLVRSIKKLAPGCVVIILTNHSAEIFQREMLRSGADFFFHKATEFEKAVELLRDMAAVSARPDGWADKSDSSPAELEGARPCLSQPREAKPSENRTRSNLSSV
jgi:DNA-binding NarL/FixJ family response regulator